MKRSLLECPACGRSNIRPARRISGFEYVAMLWGKTPVRCSACGQRFALNLLTRAAIAKCPKCLTLELTTWEFKRYHVPVWKKLLLGLGAQRYRCNQCRYNFVSFRRRAAKTRS